MQITWLIVDGISHLMDFMKVGKTCP